MNAITHDRVRAILSGHVIPTQRTTEGAPQA